MRTDHTLTDAERDVLRTELKLDDAQLDEAVAWARTAGYEREDIAGVIFTAAAEASEQRTGRKPRNPLRARIFAKSPRDDRRFARFAHCALLREVLEWSDIAGRRKARSAHEVAQECGDGGGQAGFAGFGWGVPGVDDSEGQPA